VIQRCLRSLRRWTGTLRLPVPPSRPVAENEPVSRVGTARSRLSQIRRARAALIWLLGLLLASHVMFWLGLEYGLDVLRDPEYGVRLRSLRRIIDERPGRPLVLVMGSSRVAMGLRPHVLADGPSDPVVFNAARIGGGPLLERLMLKRYLRAGVRPDAVLIEIWPRFFSGYELVCIEPRRLRLAELVELRHQPDESARLSRQCLHAHFAAWADYRAELMHNLLPNWAPDPDQARRQAIGWTWAHVDAWGWTPLRQPAVTGQDRAEVIMRVRAELGPCLQDQPFYPAAEEEYRDLLAFCREQGLRCALLYLPESSEFRALYGPRPWERFQEIVADLQREFGVELIDGRCAVVDEDLPDGHHLSPEGAIRFTRWLEREGLTPWLWRCGDAAEYP
jgi:hypothetical protein